MSQHREQWKKQETMPGRDRGLQLLHLLLFFKIKLLSSFYIRKEYLIVGSSFFLWSCAWGPSDTPSLSYQSRGGSLQDLLEALAKQEAYQHSPLSGSPHWQSGRGDQGLLDEHGYFTIWLHVSDDPRALRQSWGQMDVYSSPAGRALEQDGWSVLPECAMDEYHGQCLRVSRGISSNSVTCRCYRLEGSCSSQDRNKEIKEGAEINRESEEHLEGKKFIQEVMGQLSTLRQCTLDSEDGAGACLIWSHASSSPLGGLALDSHGHRADPFVLWVSLTSGLALAGAGAEWISSFLRSFFW